VHGAEVDVHALCLTEAIIEATVQSAEGRPVTEIRPSGGALRHVFPQMLAFDFALVANDTVCDGAFLRMRAIPARLHCRGRRTEREIERPVFRRPACDSADGDVVAGSELEIESIVLEEQLSCTEGS